MEAIVDVSAVDQEHIAQWLMDTTGSQESAVQAATLRLEAAQSVPKFALFLLMLSAGLFFSQLLLSMKCCVARRMLDASGGNCTDIGAQSGNHRVIHTDGHSCNGLSRNLSLTAMAPVSLVLMAILYSVSHRSQTTNVKKALCTRQLQFSDTEIISDISMFIM